MTQLELMLIIMLWMVPSAVFAAVMMDRDRDRIYEQWRPSLPIDHVRKDKFGVPETLIVLLMGVTGPIGAIGVYICHVAWFRTWRI